MVWDCIHDGFYTDRSNRFVQIETRLSRLERYRHEDGTLEKTFNQYDCINISIRKTILNSVYVLSTFSAFTVVSYVKSQILFLFLFV